MNRTLKEHEKYFDKSYIFLAKKERNLNMNCRTAEQESFLYKKNIDLILQKMHNIVNYLIWTILI